MTTNGMELPPGVRDLLSADCQQLNLSYVLSYGAGVRRGRADATAQTSSPIQPPSEPKPEKEWDGLLADGTISEFWVGAAPLKKPGQESKNSEAGPD